EDGNWNGRVVSLLESQGTLYVAANHWPRAWYHNALDRPEVKATIEGEEANYLAVPVSDEEHDRLMAGNPQGIVFKFLTGFPPRYFVRLAQRRGGALGLSA
ncbi:MAG: nitroreductase/quinone reductase family protein, partial [Gammaproteobacteria bacterium]|nr:nitroreductase/quinone reductase family protein [Gammaproteobacteria bacterium]